MGCTINMPSCSNPGGGGEKKVVIATAGIKKKEIKEIRQRGSKTADFCGCFD